MAESDRQGTGRHPHKSTEEPYPHTRDKQGEGEHRSRASGASSHSGGGSDRTSQGSSRSAEASRAEHRGSSPQDPDLKEREYRDEKGEIHHHTWTYMEQHKGEKDK